MNQMHFTQWDTQLWTLQLCNVRWQRAHKTKRKMAAGIKR